MIATNAQWQELLELQSKFKDKFNETIPLLMMPETVTFEDVRIAVEKCFTEGKDLLGEVFGYSELVSDPNILM